MAIGGGSRKQVLDLVKRKAAILQLGRTALGNDAHRWAHLTPGLESLIAAANIRQLSASRHNIVVTQLVAFPAVAPHRYDHYLAVARGLWISQAEDADRLELACENLSAFADMRRRHDENENASGLQPSIRVRQKRPLRTLASNASWSNRRADLKTAARTIQQGNGR